MNARSTAARRGFVASALAAAADWLIEPAEPLTASRRPAFSGRHPVVAVVGLCRRAGATTVARALGTELAARHPGGACVVTSDGPSVTLPLGLPGAARLARSLAPLFDDRTRACGRLCLVDAPDCVTLADAARPLAPLVIDVEDAARASAAAALADRVLLVGNPSTEPALATVLAESLARVGPAPLAVLNRADRDLGPWLDRAAVELPESRMGCRLALAGRDPRGRFGEGVARLADRCEQPG